MAITVGQIFGRWTVMSAAEQTDKWRRPLWNVRCVCGQEKALAAGVLVSGQSQSCGCLHKERASTHGLRDNPLYDTHRHMMARCYDADHQAFARYGGRGIKVCADWHTLTGFIQGVQADIGHKPNKALQLDRRDNEKGYEPGNIRWATAKVNNRNRRNNLMVQHDGEEMTLAELAEKLNIPYSTLYARIWRKANGRKSRARADAK